MAQQNHPTSTPRKKTLRPDTRLTHGGPTATAIAQLLADQTLNYDEIAKRVRENLPGAQTSSRSVASIASRLRKEGYKVPDRRFVDAREKVKTDQGQGQADDTSPITQAEMTIAI